MIALGKRRWALRVLEEAGIPVTGKVGDGVMQALMAQAKSPTNLGQGDKGAVLFGVHTMVTDFKAVSDLEYLGLSNSEAIWALAKIGDASSRILDRHLEDHMGART